MTGTNPLQPSGKLQPQMASTRALSKQPKSSLSLTQQQNQNRVAKSGVIQRPQTQPRGTAPQMLSSQTRSAQFNGAPQSFTYDLGGRAVPVRRAAPAQALRNAPPHAQSPNGQIRRAPVMGQQGVNQQVVPQQRPIQRPRQQPFAMQQRPQQVNTMPSSRDRRRQQGPNRVYTSPQAANQAYAPSYDNRVARPAPQYRPDQRQSNQSQAQAPQVRTEQRARGHQQTQQQALTRRSASQPMTYQSAQMASTQQRTKKLEGAAPPRGLSPAQAERSLYGSLNDDVRVPNPYATVPQNPDLPIPTMAARRTLPVEQEGLDALAGGPKP